MTWIKTTDRLPEEDNIQVIVCLTFTRDEPEVICAVYRKDGGFFNLEDKPWNFVNVSHWMPLPSAPIEKDTKE